MPRNRLSDRDFGKALRRAEAERTRRESRKEAEANADRERREAARIRAREAAEEMAP